MMAPPRSHWSTAGTPAQQTTVTASVINIDPVVSGKHVGIRSSLQEQTRSASARRRSMPDQPTGSIIMNTAVGSRAQLSVDRKPYLAAVSSPRANTKDPDVIPNNLQNLSCQSKVLGGG